MSKNHKISAYRRYQEAVSLSKNEELILAPEDEWLLGGPSDTRLADEITINAIMPEDDPATIVWQPHPGSQELFLNSDVFETLLAGSRGGGKRISLDTPVFTDRGWVAAGEVTMDDMLLAPDGKYAPIAGIYPHPPQQMYRVTFLDGPSVVVGAEHKWMANTGKDDTWRVRNTQEMIDAPHVAWYIPLLEKPAPGKKWRGPDPYTIGYLIANGTMKGQYPTIYTAEDELRDRFAKDGWAVYKYRKKVSMIQALTDFAPTWRDHVPKEKAHDKYIPERLKHADPDTRLALLQGLMDGDGSVCKEGRCSYATVSPRLAKDVQYLVQSLGGKATVKWKKKVTSLGGVGYYHVAVMHCNKFNPFQLHRKKERVKQMIGVRRRILSIEPEKIAPAVCFAIAHPSHQYVIDSFVVTHNTDSLIMDFLQHVDVGWGAEWRGILFRQTYPQLADVVKKTRKWIPKLFPGAVFNKNDFTWTFPSGEQLLLRHMKSADDYYNYHGHEYPFVGFEELTNWASPDCYTLMISCIRSSVSPNKRDKFGRTMPRKLRATTNPAGRGFQWVKKRFHLPGGFGKIIVESDVIEGVEQVARPRVAINSHFVENKTLMEAEPNYAQSVIAAARSPAEKAAWLLGDWNISSGGMFDDLWTPSVHIIKPFEIPKTWRIDRSFDWGSSKPASVGWWAESDGTDIVYPDGSRRSTVKGDLFRIAEWYVAAHGTNKGMKMTATAIAAGIVRREIEMGYRTWVFANTGRVQPGPADTSIWDLNGTKSIAEQMRASVKIDGKRLRGVQWTKADKSSGSRRGGWEAIRNRLEAALPDEEGMREHPGLFIFANCKKWIEHVPSLPRDEDDTDDVDTETEDHIGDETRYRIYKKKRLIGSGRQN